MKVAVVGAGIVGASAARQLALRDHSVVLFDQFEFGHRHGSSHGNSRIVRKAYEDPKYTAIMLEAYPLWRELEASAQETLYHEVGLLYFGGANAPGIRNVVASLTANGVNHQVNEPAEVARRLPELRLGADEVGVFTPEAGWVHATQAVMATIRLASEAGATLRSQMSVDLDVLEKSFDRVVLALGGWIRRFVDVPVKVTCQTFYYAVNLRHLGPVWIEDGPDFAYGFPTEPHGMGVKVAFHRPGPEVDPSGPRPEEDPRGFFDLMSRRFGQIPDFTQNTCLYTSTVDEGFRFGRLGDRIVWGSACSGHGFKFGPWTGKVLADIAEEKANPSDWPDFACQASRV